MMNSLLYFSQRRLLAATRLPLSSQLLVRQSFKAFSQHQTVKLDDEESVPENFREDRTLHMAQNTPHLKNDTLLNEIMNKEHNMASLSNIFNSHQRDMSLLHHSFLLYKLNSVYKEIKRRQGQHAEQEEKTGPNLENAATAQQIGNSVFKQVCFIINRNVKDLDT